MRVLIIEDEEVLGDGIRAMLNQRDFTAEWCRDGLTGLQLLAQNSYDVLVLDLNLPQVSGFEVLNSLRAKNNPIPVLVLTARAEVADRVETLDTGADDYLIKPFDVDELCARLRALHRRSLGQSSALLRHQELVLNPSAHTVTVDDRPVNLSKTEFAILRQLLEKAGRVLSRRQLEVSIYGLEGELGSNAVEVHIHHLRSKLGINPIRTVRGVGYIIEKPAR